MTKFSFADLNQFFDPDILNQAKPLASLTEADLVVTETGVETRVFDGTKEYSVIFVPHRARGRVVISGRCSCHKTACVHLAAVALRVLTSQEKKKYSQQIFPAFMVEPEIRSGFLRVRIALRDLNADKERLITSEEALLFPSLMEDEEIRSICEILNSEEHELIIKMAKSWASQIISQLIKSGRSYWRQSGVLLVSGPVRPLDEERAVRERLTLISYGRQRWYVDQASGACGIAVQPASKVTKSVRVNKNGKHIRTETSDIDISVGNFTPVLRFASRESVLGSKGLCQFDTVQLCFDYGGTLIVADDERSTILPEGKEPMAVRRDCENESKALDLLRAEGLVQIRVDSKTAARGERVHIFLDEYAAERWQRFMAIRVPEFTAKGWSIVIAESFGSHRIDVSEGAIELNVSDAKPGWFTLEFGIDIEGVQVPLTSILRRVLEMGGAAAVTGPDGMAHLMLEDGRMLAISGERLSRILSMVDDLLIITERTNDNNKLVLPMSEAAVLPGLEEIVTTRWQNASAIRNYLRCFHEEQAVPLVPLPKGLTTTLRPYQHYGFSWLQHLRLHGLSGILADDMGLGKTVQTITHLLAEYETGRLECPAIIVVPASLITNWVAELKKFASNLQTMIYHGSTRHERLSDFELTNVVITSYAVLTRDIERLRERDWHIIVLDESQAIKDVDSKTARAVCQLKTNHKLCLSGTPIENNLSELWSQFVFLMPGLLGERKNFTTRFRVPIEKKQDTVRQAQLAYRIRPFILRRAKIAVARDLPPKHNITRHILFGEQQREFYETIRATLYDRVRASLGKDNSSQSRIVLLDALLKLRQVCCDPRLVKLNAEHDVKDSAKLDDLLSIVCAMISEGRRILLFSQFTSMLDLIKPELDLRGVSYVELYGSTVDRATPISRFEAGEVPLFLISLRAGGRGLNLVSADTVIHYDPWWNPAVEEQASDRAHRIGQTKSVFIYKLIAAGTVEERIVELQERKSALADLAFGAKMPMGGIRFEDIDYLFAPGNGT